MNTPPSAQGRFYHVHLPMHHKNSSCYSVVMSYKHIMLFAKNQKLPDITS